MTAAHRFTGDAFDSQSQPMSSPLESPGANPDRGQGERPDAGKFVLIHHLKPWLPQRPPPIRIPLALMRIE